MLLNFDHLPNHQVLAEVYTALALGEVHGLQSLCSAMSYKVQQAMVSHVDESIIATDMLR